MILGNALSKASEQLKEAASELARNINPNGDENGVHLYRVVHVSDTSFKAMPYIQLGNQILPWNRFESSVPKSLLHRGNGLFILNEAPAKPKK